jgi:hypothetical protein
VGVPATSGNPREEEGIEMKRYWLVLGGVLILSFITPAPSHACTLEGKTFCGKHVYRCRGKDPHKRGYNDVIVVDIG